MTWAVTVAVTVTVTVTLTLPATVKVTVAMIGADLTARRLGSAVLIAREMPLVSQVALM